MEATGYPGPMITGLVLVERGVEALAVTLAALVPGVAEGLVGDAIVIARAPDRDIERVADATGATLVELSAGEDPWRAAAPLARRDWLFCLSAGDVPGEGWIRAIDRFALAAAGAGLPQGRLARARSVPERLALLGEGRVRAARLRPGDLVHRGRLDDPARRIVPVAARILRDPL
jgi:F0F1-type ATP synthase membrane subunit c/vacuolar-type H+-ATPase subunit K